MNLVITHCTRQLREAIASYKYRSAVVLEPPPSSLPQLVGAAYAVLFLQASDSNNIAVVNALKANKAMLCHRQNDFEPLAGTAALYAASLEPPVLAALMTQVYTNEPQLLQLQAAAQQLAHQYSWKQVAQNLMINLRPLLTP